MITSIVSQHIPLADIVEEYVNTPYHLLMFRDNFTFIADLGIVEAHSELDTVNH